MAFIGTVVLQYAPRRCKVVHMKEGLSDTIRTPGRRLSESTRVSVTFPAEHYRRMNEKAEREGLSTACVVRRAVEEYLARESSSLKRGKKR